MKLILGSMSFRLANTSSQPNTNQLNSIFNYYRSHQNYLQLDTAKYYNNEAVLGNCDLNGFKIDTKANPWYNNDFSNGILGQLSPNLLRNQLENSLNDLKIDSCNIFYLHAPDNNTNIIETLEECDRLYRTEKFNYLGISNYSDRQLQEILDISENNMFNSPKYYQGMFNPICRKVDTIRNKLSDWNMDFNAYNILAGGLLTGKYDLNNPNLLESRFKNNSIYQNIFWKPEILNAVNNIKNKLLVKDQSLIELVYSWLKYSSRLSENDGIILGASSLDQWKNNLDILENIKPLSQYQIKGINQIWKDISEFTPNYYY